MTAPRSFKRPGSTSAISIALPRRRPREISTTRCCSSIRIASIPARSGLRRARSNRKTGANERSFLMRQLQLMAHGEPPDVIELHTVSEPVLGQEEVLVSMEAAPLNPSDFLSVRGTYGVRPAFPSSVGAEGVGRAAKIGSKVDVALQSKRVLILPTYEQVTCADHVVVP